MAVKYPGSDLPVFAQTKQRCAAPGKAYRQLANLGRPNFLTLGANGLGRWTKSRRLNLACDPRVHFLHDNTAQARKLSLSRIPLGRIFPDRHGRKVIIDKILLLYSKRPRWLPGKFRCVRSSLRHVIADRIGRGGNRWQPRGALDTSHAPNPTTTIHQIPHHPSPCHLQPSQLIPTNQHLLPDTSGPAPTPNRHQPSPEPSLPTIHQTHKLTTLPPHENRFNSSTLHQRDSRNDLFKGYTGGATSRTATASPSRQYHQQQPPYSQQQPQQQPQGYGYGGYGPQPGGSHLGVAESRGGYRPATPNRKYV